MVGMGHSTWLRKPSDIRIGVGVMAFRPSVAGARPIKVKGLDAATSAVLERYPDARVEGSTGFSRSYWIKGNGGSILVAKADHKRWKGDPLTEIPFLVSFVDPDNDLDSPVPG
jgi:hypothetical protein